VKEKKKEKTEKKKKGCKSRCPKNKMYRFYNNNNQNRRLPPLLLAVDVGVDNVDQAIVGEGLGEVTVQAMLDDEVVRVVLRRVRNNRGRGIQPIFPIKFPKGRMSNGYKKNNK